MSGSRSTITAVEPLVNTGQRYPILSEWMKGAGSKHPYATEFQAAPKYDYGQWAELDYLESLLSGLHRAGAGRLEGKRRDFRKLRDKPGHLGMRAELVVAGRLADRGIGFDFGATGTPQPDMVLRDLGLGIEVTTRSTNAEWVLKRELAMAMRVHRPKVHFLMEYSAKPFTIRSKVREQIIQEVHRAVTDDESEVHCVVRPAKDGQPAITLKVTIQPMGKYQIGFWPDVRLAESPDLLKPLMIDGEEALVGAMEEKRKRRQAEAMPTVLVVDVAGIEGSWLRTTRSWGDRLVQLIKPNHRFAALAVMVSAGWRTDFRLILGESRYVSASIIPELKELEWRLGLKQLEVKPPQLRP